MTRRIAIPAVLFAAVAGSVAGFVAGCATRRASAPGVTAATRPATGPAERPESVLTLEQIPPPLSLPAPKPATRPSTQPAPLDAIEDYARARTAMLDGQRFAAIMYLEKAIALDPDSFELYHDLARAYLGNSNANEKAIDALEKAAAIRPDDLETRAELGRQYLARNELDKALVELRLARLTTDYRRDDDRAIIVDLFLARALQQKGYDRAALEEYESLLDRLNRQSHGMHGDPELAFLLGRPETILVQMAELYEKHGQYDPALEAYSEAAEHEPGNFDLQARPVRTLLAAGRARDAVNRAADLVSRFHASNESVNLLRDVYRQLGREQDVFAELTRLHEARPQDKAVLFALTDLQRAAGRSAEAERLLVAAAGYTGADPEVVQRLFRLYDQRDDSEAAARLLIESAARRPDSVRELGPLWADLLRPGRRNRLRLPAIQGIEVSPSAKAAKLFWVSRVADIWRRDALALGTMEQAAKLSPPFPPAYRAVLLQYWNRADWDDAQKADASRKLADAAGAGGDASLAAELTGLTLLRQNQPQRALEALAEALGKTKDPSPDLLFTYATVLQAQNQSARAEDALRRIVNTRPSYEDAWAMLFQHYLNRNEGAKAFKVLTDWLAAQPDTINGRLLFATVQAQARHTDAAEKTLLELFKEQPDNAQVVSAMEGLYGQTGKVDELIAKFEDERSRHPDNQTVVEALVDLYSSGKRFAEASRVLDATRAAVGKDPDLLYYIAHLYDRIDQKRTSEQVLEEVVRIDPRHAAAANDLGYTWADQGRNLDRAESLIRVAVKEEPDNQSFLDSLGWVLYKRGKFDEARQYLQQAIGAGNRPDPVVLDHLGDALYRLSEKIEASKQWQRSLERLGETDPAERDDLKELRLQLRQKLQQDQKGQPVTVAPIATTSN